MNLVQNYFERYFRKYIFVLNEIMDESGAERAEPEAGVNWSNSRASECPPVLSIFRRVKSPVGKVEQKSAEVLLFFPFVKM